MVENQRKILVSEIELSVRTFELLTDLKIYTLGDLLDRSTIECSSMSQKELNEVFLEFGVTFHGKFLTPESEKNILKATGTLSERWKIISQWLTENNSTYLEGFAAPAELEQVRKIEEEININLPEEFKEFLLIHNGQISDVEPMVWTCALFQADEIIEEWKNLLDLLDENQVFADGTADKGIRTVEFSRRWIPIGRSARGRDYLCIDLDPSEDGMSGQIILIAVDFIEHTLIADNFKDLLSIYFTQLQTGEIYD